MGFEDNHTLTNLTLIQENVIQRDENGNQIYTRIFEGTKTVDLTIAEASLNFRKRQLERSIAWYDDIIAQMAGVSSITP